MSLDPAKIYPDFDEYLTPPELDYCINKLLELIDCDATLYPATDGFDGLGFTVSDIYRVQYELDRVDATDVVYNKLFRCFRHALFLNSL
jgi:hypothetical protein